MHNKEGLRGIKAMLKEKVRGILEEGVIKMKVP